MKKDSDYVAAWRMYLTGLPGPSIKDLYEDLSIFAAAKLGGIVNLLTPAYKADVHIIGELIAQTLRERGELECPTTPNVPNTDP